MLLFAEVKVRKFEFDIALSFAGEDRLYVDQVANRLQDQGVRVFYDKFEEVSLWGKNLYDYLTEIYQNKARFTVMFISNAYAEKVWPNHERQAMQARAFQEGAEYVLPARFDDTKIPGVLPTIGYVSLADKTPAEFAELITKKLINSGATIPSEQLRRNFSTIHPLPRVDIKEFVARVITSNGDPISQVDVAAVADNGTYINGKTDDQGFAKLSFSTRRAYTLICAHQNFPAAIHEQVDPAQNLEIIIPQSENIGSAICRSAGHIVGLEGQLNPILDTSNRTYIYADNIAINGGVGQPATFHINDPMDMEDRNGAVFLVTVKFIKARISLLQYIKPVYEYRTLTLGVDDK
jgi:hypothetical protein